ncbi:MAG: alpha-ketoacid dehydrogenase subunit beta [Candidatus Diapherotrites archaeon]|nr:alpha-ketoacid dehydrogenase subunit beta [Candidatus Diapherotrites archaeon]
MSVMNMVQAINAALGQEMQADARVIVLGEDVGRDGGVFRVTEGLLEKFGENRVIDTPLSELGIVGASIGLAVNGMRPIAEIQFDGFTYAGLDQLIDHASRIRTRSRGAYSCPLVVRFPCGGGIHAPEHHSESPETYFVHTPGLKVVCPSTPGDAKGLLASCVQDPDPCIFMEPKRIYRAVKEEVNEERYTIPFGVAKGVREGEDVTLIAWGAMVRECVKAADQLEAEHVSCEVLDVRSLKPLDVNAIVNSVKKTGRVLVVHEAPKTLGLGAEIVALIQEHAFLSLEAPVGRVTGFDVAMPLYKLEEAYLPNVNRIVEGVRRTVLF